MSPTQKRKFLVTHVMETKNRREERTHKIIQSEKYTTTTTKKVHRNWQTESARLFCVRYGRKLETGELLFLDSDQYFFPIAENDVCVFYQHTQIHALSPLPNVCICT